MLNHKLKNLQRFLQEVSDTAFEFTSLNSEFTAIPTTYDEHFQTVLSARREELSQLLHEIALEQAFSQNSIKLVNSDGRGVDTKYIAEDGNVIADIDDGSDAVYVVRKGNEDALITELVQENVINDNQDAEVNAFIGKKNGYNLKDIEQNAAREFPTLQGNYSDLGFYSGYNVGYGGENSNTGVDAVLSAGDRGFSMGSTIGYKVGRRHKKQGKMNMFFPKIQKGEPLIDFDSMICGIREIRENTIINSKINYTVRKGDTLSSLAILNNTTIYNLVKLNNIKNRNHIEIGQQIKLH